MSEEREQNFISWLEKGHIKNHKYSECVKCLEFVSDYAIKRRISKASFWNIDDYKHFNVIRNAISGDRLFRLTYKNAARNFDVAGKLYSDFLKETISSTQTQKVFVAPEQEREDRPDENSVAEETFDEEKGSTFSIGELLLNQPKTQPSALATKKDETTVLKPTTNASNAAAQAPEKMYVYHPKYGYGVVVKIYDEKYAIHFYVDTENQRIISEHFKSLQTISESEYQEGINGVRRVDFSASDADYSFGCVEFVSYFGDEKRHVVTWREAYNFILKNIYEDYPHKIDELLRSSDAVAAKTRISRNKSDMRSAIEFAPGLYAEGNRSAGEIVRAIASLLSFCNVDYENVIILKQIFIIFEMVRKIIFPAISVYRSREWTAKCFCIDLI